MRIKPDEAKRLYDMTENERSFWDEGLSVCGMDEVGRGPLAGPVVTACVTLPKQPLICGINDSKKLSEKKRSELYSRIKEQTDIIGIAFVSEKEIDELNILNATKKAFSLSYNRMAEIKRPDAALVDAVEGLDIDVPQHPIIHGDALSYLIAAASIIAKVERDAYMAKMHELYPEYNFLKNKGYGTAEHIAALKKYGPCPIHRMSFLTKILQ